MKEAYAEIARIKAKGKNGLDGKETIRTAYGRLTIRMSKRNLIVILCPCLTIAQDIV